MGSEPEKTTRRGLVSGEMTVRTGRHGEKVSLLGYGAMRLPTADGKHAYTRAYRFRDFPELYQ